MPYILSPQIFPNTSGMWGEGDSYEKRNIFSIKDSELPPVNYDEHLLRPHSLTHLETPAHVDETGKSLDFYYAQCPHFFFGKTLVLKLTGNHYEPVQESIHHWIISKAQIEERLDILGITEIPPKVLITSQTYPRLPSGFHDPSYVLTLSESSAEFLVNIKNFNLYGTSWKSSDFNPGKVGRPIHRLLFEKALILENLDLYHVPEGIYFMSAFPLPLVGASESPVVPALFKREEILTSLD